jgi:hypothetical protein
LKGFDVLLSEKRVGHGRLPWGFERWLCARLVERARGASHPFARALIGRVLIGGGALFRRIVRRAMAAS